MLSYLNLSQYRFCSLFYPRFIFRYEWKTIESQSTSDITLESLVHWTQTKRLLLAAIELAFENNFIYSGTEKLKLERSTKKQD